MDNTSTRRRRGAVCASAVAALLVTALMGAAGPAAAAPPRPPSGVNTPVGVWDAVVTRPGETHGATFTFVADGRTCLDLDGVRVGTGTWTATGRGAFRYQVREMFRESDGTIVGYVDIDQAARQTGNRYGSSGESKIYEPDGTYVGSVQSSVTATRSSTTASGC
ncbi:MAG: hypothetical protein LH603_20165 [Pseudonocardia sp.]|nr:hypothetical protein [Pseudonocardia sp.]